MDIIKNGKALALRGRYRYAVYERKLVHEGAGMYSRCFIVLKNQYGVIARFTGLHKYVDSYENRVYRPLASDAREKLLYVCSMLNYVLVEQYDSFGVSHVFQINKTMLERFFQDYALKPLENGTHRSRQSIEKCVGTVTSFFRRLCHAYSGYMGITTGELYREKVVYGVRGGARKRLSPDFQVRGIAENRRIFRDIPTNVFAILLNQAWKHTPDIAFAICVQAFAGLRPGEAMCLRQECSPLGGGIAVTMQEGKLKSAELDLTHEYSLRSDGVVCGRIKKERRQKVYPAFLPAFAVAYSRHKNYLCSKSVEPAYSPLFVNRQGLAMTYANYRDRFKQLIEKHVRPILLSNEDAECRICGQMLFEHRLGPHAFRHWFSVQLVLMGEDIAQIQYWRGDTSPESALTYLQNKGELVRQLSVVNESFAEALQRGVAADGR